jgi:hypothetical protein
MVEPTRSKIFDVDSFVLDEYFLLRTGPLVRDRWKWLTSAGYFLGLAGTCFGSLSSVINSIVAAGFIVKQPSIEISEELCR